ncbi:hypothetical protein ABFX02_12G043600 [Erythranthe guttata]
MDSVKSVNLSIQDNVLQPLFISSGSSTLHEALERLIETAKTSDGRLSLSSKDIIKPALELCQYPLRVPHQELLLAVKLLRNMCAGEIKNQDLFIEQNGVGILSTLVGSMCSNSGSDNEIFRMVLQALGNVSLAGEKHQEAVWAQFFSLGFINIARVQSKETCDPLCMVIYTCSEGSNERSVEMLSDQGLDIIVEIVRTVTAVGFSEDWVKLLLSKICFDKSYFSSIFSKLSENCDENVPQISHFGDQEAFLLSILSEILNERLGEIVVSSNFTLSIFQILRNAVEIVDFSTRANSSLPTGSSVTDVMGYAFSLIRDITACDGPNVDILLPAGLIKFLIDLLRNLEPPTLIRRSTGHADTENDTTPRFSKYCCPYKGFRRDIVGVIGNCSYGRISVQDEIRDQDGILLMLQQCVTDEDNPFFREWGIWSMRNILEGNVKNRELVVDLEVQGSVDTPEIAGAGLRVEIDPVTRRPKLVNAA